MGLTFPELPLLDLPWWGYVLVALAFTHVTIVATTVFLHRCQAHRALDLHPAVSHFFRFWLWLTTGMVTREWIAVHRKHHARVETPEDPHSPQVLGINRILWLGVVEYHRQARVPGTLEAFGHGAPADWLERNVYSRHTSAGVGMMMAVDLALFGIVPGLAVWAVQMAWIPFWAAGVINGIGHYWGYRNYEVPDASRNIVPWALVIGGEELHNNHHAYASSARFSCRRFEVDLGWIYIRALQALALARVRKSIPRLVETPGKPHCDEETVRAVVGNRFQVMANFGHQVLKRVCREELGGGTRTGPRALPLRPGHARRLLLREHTTLDARSRQWLDHLLEHSPRLRTVYDMRQRLQDTWNRSWSSGEGLRLALEEWCRAAEASGVDALREFSVRLRGYSLATCA